MGGSYEAHLATSCANGSPDLIISSRQLPKKTLYRANDRRAPELYERARSRRSPADGYAKHIGSSRAGISRGVTQWQTIRHRSALTLPARAPPRKTANSAARFARGRPTSPTSSAVVGTPHAPPHSPLRHTNRKTRKNRRKLFPDTRLALHSLVAPTYRAAER